METKSYTLVSSNFDMRNKLVNIYGGVYVLERCKTSKKDSTKNQWCKGGNGQKTHTGKWDGWYILLHGWLLIKFPDIPPLHLIKKKKNQKKKKSMHIQLSSSQISITFSPLQSPVERKRHLLLLQWSNLHQINLNFSL